MAPAVQTYETHRHNPKPTGVAAVFWLIAIVCFILAAFGFRTLGVGLVALAAAVLVLIAISRIYTTALQDRIIKLEMQLRSSRVLSPAQQASLSRLRKPQVVALRFASDGELPELVERAERENLDADQIKRAIRSWVPDYDRT
jgi:hypothetical protein